MAGASKRTTIGLAVVAIVFIIVIIVLCLVPDPCRRLDPRPECRRIAYARYNGTDKPTERTASTESSWSSSSSTATSTESTKSMTLTGTTTDSPTSMSTAITSSSSATTSSSSTDSTVTSTTEFTGSSTTSSTDIMANETTTEDKDDDRMFTESSTMTSISELTTSTDIIVNETTTDDDDDDHAITESSTMTSISDSTTSTDIMANETTTDNEDVDRAITESSTTSLATTEFESGTNATDETTTEALYENSTTTIVTETEEEDETSTASTATTEVTTPSETTEETTTTQETTQQRTTTQEADRTSEVTTAITPPDDGGNVCNTKICKEVARRMLDIMDPSDVDPCEDFYQYSCGGILDDPFLKPEDPQLPADVLLKEALERGDRNDVDLKELFAVYDSCMAYKSQDAAEAFFELGYVFNPRSKDKYKGEFTPPTYSDTFDLSSALAKMMKRHFAPLFDIMIDVDDEDREAFQLKMTLPAFESAFSGDFSKAVCYDQYKATADEAKANGEIFDINSNYEDYVNCTRVGRGLMKRLSYMVEAAEDLQLLDEFKEEVKTDILQETRFDTEMLLKHIASVTPSPPDVKKKLSTKDYKTFSVTEMSKESVFGKTPINFERFISELLGKSISPGDTFIQVYFMDELKEIFGYINEEYYEESKEPTMQNILLLLWAEQVFQDLVRPLGPAVGSQDYCVRAVSSLMDDYASYLYLRELPKRDSLHTQIEKMIRLSKAEATNQLSNSALTCKDDYEEKLREMTGEAVSFDELRDSFLDEREVLAVNESDFLQNYISMVKNYRKRLYELSSDGSPQTVKGMWSVFLLVYKSNAVTSLSLNKFLIPYAAMNPPFYYEGVPDYINYAGIGHMIAHELMHGFDSTGTKFNYETRRTMRSDKALVHPTECLGEQIQQVQFLNSSQGFNVKLELDEKLSQNEVLSDSAAIKLAWKTYERDLINQRTPPTTTEAATQPYRQPARRRRSVESASPGTEPRVFRRGKSLRRYRKPQRMISADQRLPHLEKYDPLQLYYIKTAQNLCSHTSDVNIIDAMEKEHLPNKLRVNIMLGNDPQFIDAFACPIDSKMVPSGVPSGTKGPCPFNPMGYDVIGRGCVEN